MSASNACGPERPLLSRITVRDDSLPLLPSSQSLVLSKSAAAISTLIVKTRFAVSYSETAKRKTTHRLSRCHLSTLQE
jgi:hypothetical protein